MSVKVQLIGGAFQTPSGAPLSGGNLTFVLSQDAQVTVGSTLEQVAAGETIVVPLDADGNIITSPTQLIWPNDVLTPINTFYTVTAYTAEGQLVWGPNCQQVFSTPSPFDVGVWVPGSVNLTTGVQVTYDIGVAIPGAFFANQTTFILALERAVRFSAGLVPSTAVAVTASSTTVVFSLQRNGSEFGTLTFVSGNVRGTYTGTETTFLTNDVLTIVAPSSTDVTLSTLGLILSGVIVN